jgi:hypothetical protein
LQWRLERHGGCELFEQKRLRNDPCTAAGLVAALPGCSGGYLKIHRGMAPGYPGATPGLPRGNPRYPGVPRGTPGYPGVIGGHPEVPRGYPGVRWTRVRQSRIILFSACFTATACLMLCGMRYRRAHHCHRVYPAVSTPGLRSGECGVAQIEAMSSSSFLVESNPHACAQTRVRSPTFRGVRPVPSGNRASDGRGGWAGAPRRWHQCGHEAGRVRFSVQRKYMYREPPLAGMLFYSSWTQLASGDTASWYHVLCMGPRRMSPHGLGPALCLGSWY